jgi:hypothetical protein
LRLLYTIKLFKLFQGKISCYFFWLFWRVELWFFGKEVENYDDSSYGYEISIANIKIKHVVGLSKYKE